MKVIVNKNNPPIGGLCVLEYVRILKNIPFELTWGSENLINNVNCKNSNDIARTVAKLFFPELYGSSHREAIEIDNWLTFSMGPLCTKNELVPALNTLNKILGPITYLVAKRLTAADFIVFASLYVNKQWKDLVNSKSAPVNVLRWYNFIHSQDAVKNTLNSLPKDLYTTQGQSENYNKSNYSSVGNRNQEGKFVDLPFAETGKVVVRFPPEASGYLHIGHAKAALLNQYYQEAFEGKLILRFDDTNPAKENVHFEQVILEDVAMLEIKPDRFTFTSDYFELMLELCEKMLREGNAYVDDTDPDLMKTQRDQKIESVNRNNDVDKNLVMWEEMKKGTVKGQKSCVRAKMFMDSANGCLRDPTIYRCKNEVHPRTGNKYKVYPTYDFACPIVDAIEGVTHVLRTMEYHDRDPQFYWFIEKLGLRNPHIWEYSRLSMTNTVLSKRKLTWFVNEGLVDGWDDPRMPTVRGVLRRGMTVQGLKEFIIAQGSSRSVVFMEWDKIWSFNKKVIDPIAPRYTAIEIEDPVPVLVKEVVEECLTIPKHPKNLDVGNKEVWIGPKIYIDRVDADTLIEGENATFINWGNLLITKINSESGKIMNIEAQPNLQNTDFKKTLKITWLAEVDKAPFTPTYCVYFDHIISKPILGKDEDFKNYIGHETRKEVEMLGDPELKKLKVGDIIQLQRRGFFRVDVAYKAADLYTNKEQPVILYHIPDGHAKESIPGKVMHKAGGKKSTKAENKIQQLNLATTNENYLLQQIAVQGDKVRDLKTKKAAKNNIDTEVNTLLSLKADYKSLTGKEWKPKVVDPPVSNNINVDKNNLLLNISSQGDVIRKLKSDKVDKSIVDFEVKKLLQLKENFKNLTGTDWTTNMKSETANGDHTKNTLVAKITEQGNIVRNLKTKHASMEEIDEAVKALLDLKAQYKNETGTDFPTTGKISKSKEKKPISEPKEKPTTKERKPDNIEAGNSGFKKQTRLGLEAKKEELLSDWYSQVITKGELIEYYDVSGCYILRPWAYAIWENIKDWFDAEIKKLNVENCYFPIFVSKAALEKEKSHIADFSPEVAWVTKSGDSDMSEPVAIRPTSETIMYPAYAKWIQSYRDLPLKLNQWNNVVRWEFKHPQPFLRTREFLWQEGHTAHANREDADLEVKQILDLYAQIYTDLLAIPVIKGRKTEKEKFAGGIYTYTIEAFVSASGRAIQGATSHYLGQNFSKMFDIVFEHPDTQEKVYVHQNSWGFTTRTIGVMVMVHGDNKGLVLPPKVACTQVVIVPCGVTVNLSAEARKNLQDACNALEEQLKSSNIRVKGDYRENYSPGWKFNHWELKGVPLRIELGPKDVEKNQLVVVRRDSGEKITISRTDAATKIQDFLDDIQNMLYQKACNDLDIHKVVITDWLKFGPALDKKSIILAPFCGEISCEDNIKADSTREISDEPGALSMGAKSLCIPLEQPTPIMSNNKCIHPSCKNKPKYYTLFGRSY